MRNYLFKIIFLIIFLSILTPSYSNSGLDLIKDDWTVEHYFKTAEEFINQRYPNKARSLYKLAILNFPNRLDIQIRAYLSYGQTYFVQQRYKKALEYYQHVLELYKDPASDILPQSYKVLALHNIDFIEERLSYNYFLFSKIGKKKNKIEENKQ